MGGKKIFTEYPKLAESVRQYQEGQVMGTLAHGGTSKLAREVFQIGKG